MKPFIRVFVHLFALVAIIAVTLLAPVTSTYAAESPHATATQVYAQGGGGTGSVEAKIDAFTEKLKSIARPAGGLALVVVALSFVFAPAFKNWAEDNKRQFGLIVAGFLLLTASGDIVALLAG